MASDWVKDNIHKFAGNEKDMTIVGESAGGASVVMQLVAYGGTLLFYSLCAANWVLRTSLYRHQACELQTHSIGYRQMSNMTVVQQRFVAAAQWAAPWVDSLLIQK